MKTTERTLFLLLFASLLGACGNDALGPDLVDQADVVGGYEATEFTVTEGGETTDALADGAVFTIDLAADGTTTGRLAVPNGGEDGEDLDVGLEGTWTFEEDTNEIEFDQPADTFIRDMTFTAVRADGEVHLRGEETFSGVTLQVVLEPR